MWTDKIHIDYFLNRGIIVPGDIALGQEVVMYKILDNVHTYKIAHTSDGRWTTRVSDPTKPDGTRMIRRKSKTELYSFLIKFYDLCPDTDKTISDVFKEWCDYKATFIDATNKPISPTTIKRYKNDFRRFLAGTPIEVESINIDNMTLEEMLIAVIQVKKPFNKAWSNFHGNLNQIFMYAVRKRYIKSNPFDYIDKDKVMSFCVPDNVSDDSDRIMTLDELRGLINATYKQIAKHPKYMCNYAILLACLIGLRSGELSALRWENIDDDFIHVVIAERRFDYDDHSEIVIGEPKNRKHRHIPITEDIRALLDQIRSLNMDGDGWVFVNKDGKRHTGHDISCAVDRRAKESGLKKCSTHEIRRTVSSYLNTVLDRRTVANLLGHLPETNEKYYDYDISSTQDKLSALSKLAKSQNVTDFQSYKQSQKSSKAQ